MVQMKTLFPPFENQHSLAHSLIMNGCCVCFL